MAIQKRKAPLIAAVAVVGALIVVGCQAYDFEPVDPLAMSHQTVSKVITYQQLKPDLYLVVDKSGSMNGPTDPSLPACHNGADGGVCGPYVGELPCDTSVCPTRWSELRNAMHGFLTGDAGTLARMGLTLFPNSGDTCDVADGGSLAVDVPLQTNEDDASLLGTAQAIDTKLQSTSPGGGTPTEHGVAFADQTISAADGSARDKYILLVTDGLPNCNGALDKTTCTCTDATPDICPSTANGNLLCLDQDATTQELSAVAGRGTKTIVLGFGSETGTGMGPAVLTAMANAGGFTKRCKDGTDAECGAGDTCDTSTSLCRKPYFQASTGADLAVALQAIAAALPPPMPCQFLLGQAPSDPSLLSVLVNGVETPPGPDTWAYDTAAGPEVVAQGALCTQIKSSTKQDPIQIVIQLLKTL